MFFRTQSYNIVLNLNIYSHAEDVNTFFEKKKTKQQLTVLNFCLNWKWLALILFHDNSNLKITRHNLF